MKIRWDVIIFWGCIGICVIAMSFNSDNEYKIKEKCDNICHPYAVMDCNNYDKGYVLCFSNPPENVKLVKVR